MAASINNDLQTTKTIPASPNTKTPILDNNPRGFEPWDDPNIRVSLKRRASALLRRPVAQSSPFRLDIPRSSKAHDLATHIADETQRKLEGYGRTIDAKGRASIYETALAIACMATGKTGERPPFYLAPQPTGFGKTELIAAAVQVIAEDPALSDVGILIMVQTKEQIKDLIKRTGLHRHPEKYAVRVGKQLENNELNNMGLTGLKHTKQEKGKAHQNAQVLFTTQMKVEVMKEHSFKTSFSEFTAFHYKGKPRAVRIWDEVLTAVDALTLTITQVSEFANMLCELGEQSASQKLKKWVEGIKQNASGWTYFPVWEIELLWRKATDKKFWADLSGPTEESKLVLSAMKMLQGQEVKIVPAAWKKTDVAVSYRRSIPQDIEPLLVLDAGAGASNTLYKLFRKSSNVVELPNVTKTYRNLTVRHFDHAAGKQACRHLENVELLSSVMAEAFMDKPCGDEVLFVIHKGDKAPATKLEERTREKIREFGGDPSLAKFTTWGLHRFTNEFQEICHVVAIGIVQRSRENVIADAYGLSKKPMYAYVSKYDIEELRMSYMINDLMQAVGRGATRKGVVPKGCTLDLVVSSKGQMSFYQPMETLKKMFPGATVNEWEPKVAQVPVKKPEPKSLVTVVGAADGMLGDAQEVSVTKQQWSTRAGYGRKTMEQHFNERELPGKLSDCLREQGIELKPVYGPLGKGKYVKSWTLRRVVPEQEIGQ